MRDIIPTILAILVMFFIIGFLIYLNEEEPHKVIIDGKEYIRSKEYVGNGHYQIILIPSDSLKK
jgi:hypothetical protein